MMQAFRNSAKLAGAIFAILMLVFMLTSLDWSGLTSTTPVGKIVYEKDRCISEG